MKQKQVQTILKSTLRLLVMLRESLKAEGAEDTPLFQSVKAHADMVGLALPNKDRMTKEEMDMIRKQAVAVVVVDKVANEDNTQKIITNGTTVLPGAGQMQILNGPAADQIRKRI
jgi:hypothetical protein